MGDILTNTLSRLTMKPLSPTFQKILCEIFLSALILDPDLALQFLVQSNYLNEFFTTLFVLSKRLKL